MVDLEIRVSPTVELVYISNNPSILVEFSRRIYDIDVKSSDLPKKLVLKKHMSPLEFIDTIWYIEASRVLTHELVRHRIASFWQESQRFVKAKPIFLLPRSLLRRIEVTQFEKLLKLLHDAYMLYDELTRGTRRFGEDFKQIARYVLPQCILTKIYTKFNLRELMEVIFPLRMCRRAQPEFRYVAIKMYLLLKNVLDEQANILDLTGPRCVWLGKCPEFNIQDEEVMKKCRVEGYKEAIFEHGTDEELNRVEEIIQQLP